jgi:hypothetical protein
MSVKNWWSGADDVEPDDPDDMSTSLLLPSEDVPLMPWSLPVR